MSFLTLKTIHYFILAALFTPRGQEGPSWRVPIGPIGGNMVFMEGSNLGLRRVQGHLETTLHKDLAVAFSEAQVSLMLTGRLHPIPRVCTNHAVYGPCHEVPQYSHNDH